MCDVCQVGGSDGPHAAAGLGEAPGPLWLCRRPSASSAPGASEVYGGRLREGVEVHLPGVGRALVEGPPAWRWQETSTWRASRSWWTRGGPFS